MLKRISAFIARHRKRHYSATATEILERIMPSRPQVRQHQKSAALHVQLAEEIGWTGPSGPKSWRGRAGR